MATMTEASSGTSDETNPRHPEQDSESHMDQPRQVKQDVEAGHVANTQEGPATPGEPPDSVPYTVFTKGQRAWITLLASTAAMVSPMSSYIYYPAIVAVASDMRVSVSLVNLTITSYLIVAGIAPSIMGDLADQGGRKPVYVVMWTLYIAANVGIALQTSYPALLVLRMLQSAGSSGQYLTRRLYSRPDHSLADLWCRAYPGGLRGNLRYQHASKPWRLHRHI